MNVGLFGWYFGSRTSCLARTTRNRFQPSMVAFANCGCRLDARNICLLGLVVWYPLLFIDCPRYACLYLESLAWVPTHSVRRTAILRRQSLPARMTQKPSAHSLVHANPDEAVSPSGLMLFSGTYPAASRDPKESWRSPIRTMG